MSVRVLEKSTRVMPLLYRGPFDPLGEQVAFGQRGEAGEPDAGTVTTSVTISVADWRDLGEPTTLTVTIVPGDTLNGPS